MKNVDTVDSKKVFKDFYLYYNIYIYMFYSVYMSTFGFLWEWSELSKKDFLVIETTRCLQLRRYLVK